MYKVLREYRTHTNHLLNIYFSISYKHIIYEQIITFKVDSSINHNYHVKTIYSKE